MFNQEQYDILKRCSEKKNITEWNNYRAEQPETKINLQNADLRRASLGGAKLNEANLENADLRKVNLERVNLRGANLESAILPEDAEERLSGLKEEVEAIINLVDDITYEEFISLIKCLERLSVIVGGSLPHLNEIQISHHTEEHAACAGTEMDNMISINIPKNVAENIHGILHVAITAGQAPIDVTKAETEVGKNNLGACDGLRDILTNAGFSEGEQKAVLANLMLPEMEEDKLMKDLGVVANLVECSWIYFQV